MYYILCCFSALNSNKALIDYVPDKPNGSLFYRSWHSGRKFIAPPSLPVKVNIPESQHGDILELYDVPIHWFLST